MKHRLILALLIVFVPFQSLFSQEKGFRTSLELNFGKGLRAQIPIVTCGVDIVEGFSFNNGLSLGGGIGAVYANGLLQEIHQYMSDGSSVDLKENTITDISWGAKAFVRSKYVINSLPGCPFVVCDAGYSCRIGDKGSARMNTGFFVSPGIGGSMMLFGKKVYGIISYDAFQWSYEYLKTPHKDSDPFDQRTVWTSAIKIHLGFDF